MAKSEEQWRRHCKAGYQRATAFFKVIDELEVRPLPVYSALDRTRRRSVATPLGGSALRGMVSSPPITADVALAVLAVMEPGLVDEQRYSRRSTFIRSWETAVKWLSWRKELVDCD